MVRTRCESAKTPARVAERVLERMALEIAVLGLETWELGADGHPKVKGISDYRVDVKSDWAAVVLDAQTQARKSLRELPRAEWICVTWMSEGDLVGN